MVSRWSLLTAAVYLTFVNPVSASDFIRFIPSESGGTFTVYLSFSEASVSDIECDSEDVCTGWIPDVEVRITQTKNDLESDLSNNLILPVSMACSADLSRNGVVDLPDLTKLMENLGQPCQHRSQP